MTEEFGQQLQYIQGVLLFAGGQCLLSVRPVQLLEGWMLNSIEELLWFESVIKRTCSGWVTPVLPPILRMGYSETLKSVLEAECFVLEYFLNFWPLLTLWCKWVGSQLLTGHIWFQLPYSSLEKIWKSQAAVALEIGSFYPVVNSLCKAGFNRA